MRLKERILEESIGLGFPFTSLQPHLKMSQLLLMKFNEKTSTLTQLFSAASSTSFSYNLLRSILQNTQVMEHLMGKWYLLGHFRSYEINGRRGGHKHPLYAYCRQPCFKSGSHTLRNSQFMSNRKFLLKSTPKEGKGKQKRQPQTDAF